MSSKKESYYTPAGLVKFPKTRINDKEFGYLYTPEGITEDDSCSWKFSLILDPKLKEVKALMELLSDLAKDIKNANFSPYKNDKTKNEDGTITENGMIAVNFTTSWPITMVDGLKKPCKAKIGWGSKVFVKFQTSPVNNKGKIGLGRYVKAVQIVELSESVTDLSGFSEQKDGFASSSETKETPWEE